MVIELSEEADERPGLVKANCIKQLVLLCSKAVDDHIIARAANALANIALDEESRVEILKKNAVPPLLALISRSNAESVHTFVAMALRNIAANEAAQPHTAVTEVAMI